MRKRRDEVIMSSGLSDMQFQKALELSNECARRRWRHSTDLRIADIIASSKDKDDTIESVAKALAESSTEQAFLELLAVLFR